MYNAGSVLIELKLNPFCDRVVILTGKSSLSKVFETYSSTEFSVFRTVNETKQTKSYVYYFVCMYVRT